MTYSLCGETLFDFCFYFTGQPYELKVKKLGDLSEYQGKCLRSVLKVQFHERRLQFMEKEQIDAWKSNRPGERILDVG